MSHPMLNPVVGNSNISPYTDAILDKAKTLVGTGTDRAHAPREAIMCCRKGGDDFFGTGGGCGFPRQDPIRCVYEQGLMMKTGQTHT